jgi:hypothetical protein
VLTRLLLLARLREVACSHTRMPTNTQLFSAELLARLLALSSAMALLLALMSTAFESLSTYFSTAGLAEPTRLVFQNVLAA